MHSAQKYAILAIIGMIKQGLAQLEGLLMLPGDATAPSQQQQREPPPAETGYLTPAEEDRIERELEAARLAQAKAFTDRTGRLMDEQDPGEDLI